MLPTAEMVSQLGFLQTKGVKNETFYIMNNSEFLTPLKTQSKLGLTGLKEKKQAKTSKSTMYNNNMNSSRNNNSINNNNDSNINIYSNSVSMNDNNYNKQHHHQQRFFFFLREWLNYELISSTTSTPCQHNVCININTPYASSLVSIWPQVESPLFLMLDRNYYDNKNL